MDLEEIGINAGNWVDSALDRNYWRALVALNFRVPLNHGVSWLVIYSAYERVKANFNILFKN